MKRLLCLLVVFAAPSWGQTLVEAWAQAKGIKPSVPIEFVTIKGGKFTMGTDDRDNLLTDAKPAHEVSIKTFAMTKTLVTVEQYAECVAKNACTEPNTGNRCNWGVEGRQRHPINCVDWGQANQYAQFKHARLPSESEYEYAATSGGKNQKYPWGDDDAAADKAVMSGSGTMPVCSKPAGNTAQGLCDMSGNVWEWVQDRYHDSYVGAPADGSAYEGKMPYRMMRGGSFSESDADYMRAAYRLFNVPNRRLPGIGFRLAMSSR